MIKIYTDGSCRDNGKENSEGGWGVAIFEDRETGPFCLAFEGAYAVKTTNNREELKAMLKALELTQGSELKDKECVIFCDSAYVVNICNEWIWKWQSHGWTRAGGKEIENLDLIKQIYDYLTIEFNNFSIQKIKGHVGHPGNELADAIATNNGAKIAKFMRENKNMFDMGK